MNAEALVVEGLRKRYGDVEVLAGVDTALRRAEITAFVGPNGAGKSTLFQAITGEFRADAGRIVYEGSDLGGCAPWHVAQRGIGKMFQDVRVFPALSVRDNVVAALQRPRDRRFMLSLWQGARRVVAAWTQADRLLDRVGVEGLRDRPAAELSWGNQKLLAFARLLAGDFRVVLLDEPTAGVSPLLRERMRALIRQLVDAEGMTVALIEHDIAFVRQLAHRVVVLNQGRVFDAGDAHDVLRRPANLELCLGL